MNREGTLIDRWAYRGIHLAIAAAGIAAIVGSGGGGFIDLSGPPGCTGYCPVIWVSVEPVMQTAQVGGAVSFRAVAGGTVPVRQYEWCRYASGSSTCDVLPGATGSTLTLQNVNLEDDQAQYRVTASGSGASDTGYGRLLVSTAPALTFEDGEFVEADWVWAGFVGSAPGVSSSAVRVTRSTAGGNPGAYRAIEYGPLSTGSRMFATHIAQAATYDPGQFGAIYSIDFQAECKGLTGDGSAMSLRPLLTQGGRTYAGHFGYGQECGEPGWTFDNARGSMVASSFSQILAGPPCSAGEACPDFSAAGAPITFGLYTVNTFVSEGAAGVASHGVDNWRLSVWRH